jgi:hypothetical protein
MKIRMGHRGAPFEWTVGHGYEREGYTVIRAYESKGIWDLLCFRGVQVGASGFFTELIAVQVKGRESDPYTDEEKATLKAWAEKVGGKAHYAYGKRMPLKNKIPGSRQRLQKNRTVIRVVL